MLAKLAPHKQALLDAADYIRKHGWCQGESFGEGETVCAAGAIWSVNIDQWEDAMWALADHIGTPNVGDWNDKPDRTKEEVIAALEQAALT